jgi:hypothetical protein
MTTKQRVPTEKSKSVFHVSEFGPAPILEGEDSAAYDALLAGVSAAVKPSDIFEEMLIHDFVDNTWESMRFRRIKQVIVSESIPAKLESLLAPRLHRRHKKQENISEKPVASYGLLLMPEPPGPYVPGPEVALVKKWQKHEPQAVKRVEIILAEAGLSIDNAIARALIENFEPVERCDRLRTVAEARRNAALREIDRHRAAKQSRGYVRARDDLEGEIVESKTTLAKRSIGHKAA